MFPRRRFLWLALPPSLVLATALGSRAGSDPVWLTIGLAVAVAIGMLGAHLAKRWTRREHRSHYGDRLQVVQTLHLSAQHAVHAVRFDSSVFLIGTAEESITLLHPNGDRAPEPSEASGHAAEDGVDLRDTPRDVDEDRPAPTSLSQRQRPGRSALTASSLATFRNKLDAARQTSGV